MHDRVKFGTKPMAVATIAVVLVVAGAALVDIVAVEVAAHTRKRLLPK